MILYMRGGGQIGNRAVTGSSRKAKGVEEGTPEYLNNRCDA